MGRNEKIPPPLLFRMTMITGCLTFLKSASELRSYRKARSPIKSVVRRFFPAQKPAAAAMIPSMPLAPRFAPTVTALFPAAAYISRSRMGMLLELNRQSPSGISSVMSLAVWTSLSVFRFLRNSLITASTEVLCALHRRNGFPLVWAGSARDTSSQKTEISDWTRAVTICRGSLRNGWFKTMM